MLEKKRTLHPLVVLDSFEGLFKTKWAITVPALWHDPRSSDALVEWQLAGLANERLVYLLLFFAGALAIQLGNVHGLLSTRWVYGCILVLWWAYVFGVWVVGPSVLGTHIDHALVCHIHVLHRVLVVVIGGPLPGHIVSWTAPKAVETLHICCTTIDILCFKLLII